MTISILTALLMFTTSGTLYYSIELEDLRRALFNNQEFSMPNGNTYTCPITEIDNEEYFTVSKRFRF